MNYTRTHFNSFFRENLHRLRRSLGEASNSEFSTPQTQKKGRKVLIATNAFSKQPLTGKSQGWLRLKPNPATEGTFRPFGLSDFAVLPSLSKAPRIISSLSALSPASPEEKGSAAGVDTNQIQKGLSLSVETVSNINDFKKSPPVKFYNQCFDKSRLKNFVLWFLLHYGEHKTVKLVEQLKTIGFDYASKAGISLGIDDLKIPPRKTELMYDAEKQTKLTINQYVRGEITGVERFQRLIDTWHRTSEILKQEVIEYFEATDLLNPVYMMAFSGARGNISQVRQLVGMRGLMADPQGQIIDFPIRSNFREGLTLTEYIISSYGARKGIVDTALRTANAGYLTRRLVDVAQHVIISNFDCGTRRGIFLIDMKEGNKTIHSLTQRAVGRILARDLFLSPEGTSIETFGQKEGESQSSLDVPPTENLIKVASRNQEINVELAFEIGKKFEKIFVRSPLTCETSKLICQLCYGWSLAQGNLVSIGEAVGVVAAQSIGEPGTQLTMRTFHTGGVFSGDISDQIRAPFDGIVEYLSAIPGTLIRTPEGKIAFLTKSEGSFFVRKVENSQTTSIESKKYKIPFYTLLYIRNGQKVYEKEVIAQISSISRKKNATDDAELTIKSEYEGQFYSKSLAFREKQVGPKQRLQKGSGLENKAIVLDDRRAYRPEGHNLAMDKFFEAWTWGYAWILSGKIYELQYTSPIFPKFGDRLNTKSSITQTNWKFDFNSGSAKLYLGTHFESRNVSNLNQTNKNWSLNNTISPFVNTSLNPLLPIQSSVSPKTLKRMTDQRGLKGVENSRSEFSSDSLGIQKWIGESKNSVMKPYISQPLVCFDLKKMSYQKQGYVLDLTDKFQFYSLDSNQKIRKIEQNQDSINLNKQGDRLRRISSNTKSTKSTFFSRSSLLGPPDALFYLKKLDSTKQNHLSPYILQWFPAFSHLKTGGYIFFDEGPEERFFKRSAASAKNVKAIKSLVDNRDSQANLFSFDTNLSKNNNLNRLIPEKEQKNFNTFQKFQNHKMDRRRSDSKEFGCSRLKGIRFSDKYHLLKQKILNSLNVPTSNSTTHQNSGQTRFISSEIIPLVKYSLFGMHWKNSYEMWISPTSSQRSFNQYENSELRNNSKMKKVTTVSLSSPTMSAKTVKKSLKRSYEVENSLREFSSDSLRMASLDEMRRNRISSNKNSTKLNLLKLSSSSSLYSMANQNDLMKFYSSRSLLIPNHFYKIEKKNSSFDPNGLSSQLAPSIPNSISERPQESFFTIQKYSEFFYVPFFILTNRQGCYKPLDIASKTSNTFSLLKVHISTNSIPKGISSVSSKNKPNSDFRDLENRRSRFSSTKSNLFRSTSMTAPSPYAGYHPKGHKGSKADLKTSFDSDRLGKWKNLSNRVKSMSTKLTRIRVKRIHEVNSLSTSSILFNEVNSLLQTNDINRDFESKKTRYLLNPKRLKRTDEVNSLSHKNQYRNSMKSNFVSQSNITSLYSFCKRYCGLTSTIEGKSHSILDFKNEKVINRNSLLSFYLSNEFQKISELPNSHYFSLAMADGNNFKHMKTPMPFRAVSGLSVDTWKLGTHDDGLSPKDVLDSQNADKNRDSTKYTLVRNRLRRSLGEASNGHPTKKQIFIHKEAFLKTLGFISYSEEIRQNQISNKNIKRVVNKTSPFSPLHGGKLKSIGTSRDLTKSNLFRFSKASPSNLLGPNRSSSDSRLASALTPASQAKKGQEVHKQIRYFNGKKGWVFFTNKTELNIHQKLIHPGSFIGSNLVTFNSPVFIESMLLNTVKFPDPLNEEITNKFSVCVTNEKSRYYLNESLSHHPVFSEENLKRNHEVEKSRSEFSTSSSLFRVSNEGPKSDGSSGLKSDQIILLIQPVEEYNHYDLHTEFQNSIYGLLPSKMNTEYKSLKTRIALRDRINEVDSLDPKGPSTQKITGATSNQSHADLKRIDKVKSLFSNPQTGLMKTKSLFAMDSVSYNKMKQMMIVTRGDRNSPLKRIGFAEENRLRRFSNSLADTHHKPILVNQSFESLYQWKQYRTHYWNKQKRSSQPILKYPSSDITILYNNLVNLFLSQDPAKRKRFSISGPFRDLTKSNLFRSTSKSRELTKSILFNHKFSNLSNGSSYRPSGHKATNSFLISRKALNVSSFILSYTKPFASNFSYKFTNSYFSYRSFSLADKRLDSQVSEKLVSLLTSYSRELENRRSRFSSTSSILYCSLMPFKTVSPAIVENNYGSNSPLSSSLPVNNRGFQLNPSSRHGPSTDFSLIYALLPRVFESTCFGFDLISNFNQTLLNRGAEKISLRDQNKVPLGEKGRQTTTTKFTYSFTNNLNSLDTVATTNYYSPFTGEIVHITSLPKKNFISDVLLTLGNDVTSANFKNVENPLRGFSSGSTISSPAADTAREGDESSLTLKAAAEANLLQKHQTEFIQPRCMILTKSDLISYYLPSTFREYKDIISTNQKTQYVMNDIFIRFLNMTDINFSNLRHYLQDKDVNKTNFKISQLIAGKPLKPYSNLLGDFYVYGDQISKTLAVESAGQIIHYNNNKITLRRSQPILVSPKGILHKFDGDFIDPKTPVITLSYQRLKTGDIIQGIPKVEQFFEARTTKRGRLFRDSLPSLLKALFKRYQAKLPLDLAVRQSFYKIQQILVDGVQRVYKSQGVTIADKHLEVIVKQMTSKVRIMDGAQTGFFPGEVLDLEFVEKINKFLIKKITYEPLVLGITKASLEVDSFLSAASFQQTTRVLSKAAISRKKDFLKGLKENVILGNLIPAGTGFLVYLNDFTN